MTIQNLVDQRSSATVTPHKGGSMRTLIASALLVLALGCGKSEENKPAEGTTPEAKPTTGEMKPSTPTAEAPKPTEATPAAATGEKLGITECDEYLDKMAACLDKMPEAGRAAAKSAVDATRDGWKQGMAAANTPEAKTAMAS